MPKLTTLADGSVLVTWPNDRGTIDSAQYVAHRGRVWAVTERALVPAFGGLRLHPREMLVLAVRRGMAGDRGAPPINVVRIARLVLAGALLIATYVMVRT